jgi:hypothetical protein
MRMGKRIPLLPVLFVALAASLTGCYTLIRHPDVSDAYEFDDEQEIVIVSHCGDCHVSPSRHRPFRRSPVADDERDIIVPTRSIDPSTPIRPQSDVVGPGMPAGGMVVDPAKDAKARDDANASKDKAAETIKKQVPEPKTPVKREVEEKAGESSDEKKTTDKKKERP